MNGYQLSCGCWVTGREACGTGAPLPCRRCDSTRTTVIGWSSGPVFGFPAQVA